jgi:hypothetical protein
LYIADQSTDDNIGGRIVRWSPGASSGVVIGGGRGRGSAANQIGFSTGIAVDGLGDVFIGDADNYRVQLWTPGAPAGITVADGSKTPSTGLPFQPWGVKVDENGTVYAADETNNRVIRFDHVMDHSFSDSLPGTYKAVLINASGCYYTSLPFTVSAMPASPVVSWQDTALVSSAAAGNQWYRNDSAISGATGASYHPVSSGFYSVVLTVNGCSSQASNEFLYAPAEQDTARGGSTWVSIYPNPVTDVLNLVNNEAHPVQVKVCDMYGKVIEILPEFTGTWRVSVGNLGKGMYVLYIVDPTTGGTQQKQFLKL